MIEKMIENMPAKTGKSLSEWIAVLKKERVPGSKHKDQVNLLMKDHKLGMNYADIIVHKANGTDSGSSDAEELVQKQYKGKENLKPIYDALLSRILLFGNDVEVAPKNAYVSLRRKKQFACLKPATKTRFEVEVILKGFPGQGALEIIEGAGAMCTHRIKITKLEEIDEMVINWLQLAYNEAR